MGIQKTEAIVLRTMPYGETSKIVTVLTRDSGKVGLLAKGARDTRSKYGGSLEPFTHIVMVYYDREQRDLQYLSDVSVVNAFLRIRDQLELTYLALSMSEICNRVVHGNEDSRGIFRLLRSSLENLDLAPGRSVNGLLRFLVELADELGFRLVADGCGHCDDVLDHKELALNVDRGRIVCEVCPGSLQGPAVRLSVEAASSLFHLVRARHRGVHHLVMSEPVCREIYGALMKHLQYHVEDLKGLHSLQYLRI